MQILVHTPGKPGRTRPQTLRAKSEFMEGPLSARAASVNMWKLCQQTHLATGSEISYGGAAKHFGRDVRIYN